MVSITHAAQDHVVSSTMLRVIESWKTAIAVSSSGSLVHGSLYCIAPDWQAVSHKDQTVVMDCLNLILQWPKFGYLSWTCLDLWRCWPAGVALVADDVIRKEIRVILEFLLEL